MVSIIKGTKSLIFYLFMFNTNVFADIYNFKWYNEEKQSDKIVLPDNSNFFSFTSSGIWEDNLGNYGEMKCVVSLFSDSIKGVELIGYCEAKDNKDEKFWTKLDRTSSGQELGIGKMTFLSGTSKYSRLKNISCPYAVEWVGSGGILKARCSKEINIKGLLK